MEKTYISNVQTWETYETWKLNDSKNDRKVLNFDLNKYDENSILGKKKDKHFSSSNVKSDSHNHRILFPEKVSLKANDKTDRNIKCKNNRNADINPNCLGIGFSHISLFPERLSSSTPILLDRDGSVRQKSMPNKENQ